MIIGFIVWSLVAVIFLGIGIGSRKANKAVGFFTFTKPPIAENIKNIKQYNKAVSVLWFASAAVFEIIGIPIIFLEQNSPIFVLIIFAAVFLMIVMMAAYIMIEAKYKK